MDEDPLSRDYLRLQIQSVKDLIEVKHQMTQGAIDAQGRLIEAKIKGVGDKLDTHLENYQETKKTLYGKIGKMENEIQQAKGAMKIIKWVQGLAALAIAGLFALLRWKTGT